MRGERVSHGLNSDIPVEIRNFRVCPENPRMGQRLDRPRKLDSFARDNIYGLNVGVLPKESNRSILGKEIGQKD